MRRPSAIICIAALLAAAAGIVGLQLWHGPTVLTLSSSHGVDTGDLVAFPIVVLAMAVARTQSARRRRETATSLWPRAGRASAIVLGALLLLTSAAPRAGGPLVPAGGGTLGGAIHQTFAGDPVPVGRWSYLALTYGGRVERLYVNGRQVSSRPVAGAIQAPSHPLWIGGNEPYGEHFDGLIDEVRVYDRALSPTEIRHDMATPVRRAAGLVAGYAFDAGTGARARDASGNRNTGDIHGATWAPGRYGDALRFDGSASIVSVPASASLNVTRALTLSGWVRPRILQADWRTVVQRQTDAYFLTAGSHRQAPSGWIDEVRAPAALLAAACLALVIAASGDLVSEARRRSWWLSVVLFVAGSLVDAKLAPSGALIGPALVALWLAATASSAVERAACVLAGAACIGLTIGSLADLAGVHGTLSVSGGSIARSTALGAVLLLAGLASFSAPGRSVIRR